MTSNRPVDEWGKLLGDVPAAGAILDRLLHRAEVIAINGRSHRLAESVADQIPATAAVGTGKARTQPAQPRPMPLPAIMGASPQTPGVLRIGPMPELYA